MTLSRGILSVVAGGLLSGCTVLPLNGPAYRDVTSGAAVHVEQSRHEITFDYALVDISPIVIDALNQRGDESFHKTFVGKDQGPPRLTVGVGDVLQVAVFESSSGGLFSPDTGGQARQAAFVTIPNQTVSRSGTISIPYAGTIKVTGRAVPEVEREIENKLKGRAIEPQVVITVVTQNAANASVFGEGTGASNIKLTGSGERILDLISQAGGTKYPGYELFVTLQRQGQRATVALSSLVNKPDENIYVRPGDTIYVSREQKKFTAIGAIGSVGQTSGLTGQFPFEQEHLSLNEALARAGGLLDNRANPSQVFLYRVEPRDLLAQMHVDLKAFPHEQQLIPTVYRANFRDPSEFFAAQMFPLRNKDIIYAANSDSTEIVKFLSLLREITSTVAGVSTDVRITGDVLDGRHVLAPEGGAVFGN